MIVTYQRRPISLRDLRRWHPQTKFTSTEEFPRRIVAVDSKRSFTCELCEKSYSMWYTDDGIWQQLPQDKVFDITGWDRIGRDQYDMPLDIQGVPAVELLICVECFKKVLR